MDERITTKPPHASDRTKLDSLPPAAYTHARRHSNTPNLGLARNQEISADEADTTNEHSPLIPPQANGNLGQLPPEHISVLPNEDERENASARPADEHVLATRLYLFLLTICMLGLQVCWSVEMSNGSPYLQGLGLSKNMLAFVWIAGPLSGALVQPYVGDRSDRCTSRFGRRRPFMVGGGIASIVSLIALAWAKEIVGGFLGVFGVGQTKVVTIVFAVMFIYVLDFSINVIQAAIRAFIVDNTPAVQQDVANAWAVRMSGAGNIIGFLVGFWDLPDNLGLLGNTQFKGLCAIASLSLILTLGISCFFISESPKSAQFEPPTGLLAFFRDLTHSIHTLPTQIKAVCLVQFFAWIGWFPFLFYTTLYIGELYVSPHFAKHPHLSKAQIDKLWEEGTRTGAWALFMSAIVTLATSIFLPLFVRSTAADHEEPPSTQLSPQTISTVTASRASSSTKSSDISTSYQRMFFRHQTQNYPRTGYAASDVTGHSGFHPTNAFDRLQIKWLTLKRTWLLSHLLTAALFGCTLFVLNTTSATLLVALIGISWAVTLWAPFALIATELTLHQPVHSPPLATIEEDAEVEHQPRPAAPQAGVVLGIHNVAIAAPQVISTLVSSAIFRALEKPRGSVGDESVAWVLRFGGVCMLIAAWLTLRVRD